MINYVVNWVKLSEIFSPEVAEKIMLKINTHYQRISHCQILMTESKKI